MPGRSASPSFVDQTERERAVEVRRLGARPRQRVRHCSIISHFSPPRLAHSHEGRTSDSVYLTDNLVRQAIFFGAEYLTLPYRSMAESYRQIKTARRLNLIPQSNRGVTRASDPESKKAKNKRDAPTAAWIRRRGTNIGVGRLMRHDG